MQLANDTEIESIESTVIFVYFHAFIVTLLVYDIAITMDKEVRHFWGGPNYTVNLVYFANRYIGLLGATSYMYWATFNANLLSCRLTGWMFGLSNLTTRVLIDYILMMRVIALYSKDTRLSIFLKVLFTIQGLFRLVSMIRAVSFQDIHVERMTDGVALCRVKDVSLEMLLMLWVFPIPYEVLLMVLALHRAIDFWRLRVGFRGLSLIKVIVLDQVVYIFVVVVNCLVIMSHLATRRTSLVGKVAAGALGSTFFLCILGSHMLFNLKEAAEIGSNEGTSYWSTQTSQAIEFT